MSRQWSKYQQDIFNFVRDGEGNSNVIAVAGSGKTTTIVEATKLVRGSQVFLAFNKAIAEELKGRGVNASTFHSRTYGVVKDHLGGQMDADKTHNIIKATFTPKDRSLYGGFVSKLVGLAKQGGMGFLIEDHPRTWLDIVDHHGMDLEDEEATVEAGIELAGQVLDASNHSNNFDFDDMLYVPVRDNLSLPKFDYLFVDEAQDTNAIQRALIKKMFKKHTRMTAVGDPAQAIYGFRGADNDSLHRIGREFRSTELPLSICYRCGSDIVQYARQWVDHIEAAPGAPTGKVIEHDQKWDVSVFKPLDLVLCRTTRPLLALAFKLIRQRVPVFVRGREIGQGLKHLIKKMNAGSISELKNKLSTWFSKECEKAREQDKEEKLEQLSDKFESICALAEDCDTVQEMFDIIDTIFSDKAGAVQLSTIHKSKGLEAERVFWLNRSQCPSRWARQPWQKQQEANLMYVAATRAISELHLIEE